MEVTLWLRIFTTYVSTDSKVGNKNIEPACPNPLFTLH